MTLESELCKQSPDFKPDGSAVALPSGFIVIIDLILKPGND